jgi:heme exporter protein D
LLNKYFYGIEDLSDQDIANLLQRAQSGALSNYHKAERLFLTFVPHGRTVPVVPAEAVIEQVSSWTTLDFVRYGALGLACFVGVCVLIVVLVVVTMLISSVLRERRERLRDRYRRRK